METYKITLNPIIDTNDKEFFCDRPSIDDNQGEIEAQPLDFYIYGMSENNALDNFHGFIPIKMLEHFEVTCTKELK